eukprot:3239398-Prymnesium_polylepis.1
MVIAAPPASKAIAMLTRGVRSARGARSAAMVPCASAIVVMACSAIAEAGTTLRAPPPTSLRTQRPSRLHVAVCHGRWPMLSPKAVS